MKDAIIDKLVSDDVFKSVESLLSLALIDELRVAKEHQAWLIEMSTKAEGNQRDIGSPLQEERVVYGVLIGVKARNSKTGSSAEDKLDELKFQVRKALFGFLPTAYQTDYQMLTLESGSLLRFIDGAVFWLERFQTKRIITQENLS